MAAGDSGGRDILDWLGPDTSACVFHRLDDPADLARAAAVSRSWRQFVIANGFCKSLCLRICPDVACFIRAVEVTESPPAPAAHASGASHDAERDHRVYSNLSGALVSPKPSANCIRDESKAPENVSKAPENVVVEPEPEASEDVVVEPEENQGEPEAVFGYFSPADPWVGEE